MRLPCWITCYTHVHTRALSFSLCLSLPFRMCNTYCLSTATVVSRTRLNVRLYIHCFSCCIRFRDDNHVFIRNYFFDNMIVNYNEPNTKKKCRDVANSAILGSFSKLCKATISFVMSVCQSVCPYGTTRLPLTGFLKLDI